MNFSCNLQERFEGRNCPLATCKSIFRGGIFLLQPARAFSKVEFLSCNLQERFPRWNFPLATCKSIFQAGFFLLQPARAISKQKIKERTRAPHCCSAPFDGKAAG